MKIIRSYLRKSYASIILLLVMFIMFLISIIMTYSKNDDLREKYSFNHLNPKVLIKLGANVGFAIKNGELYRIITPIFLHSGIQHFFINSLSMIGLVMVVEKRFKKMIFLFTFFVGGAQGNLLSLYANFIKENDKIIAVGASTSICAILGLYLSTVYILSFKNGTFQNVKRQIMLIIIYLVLISLMPGVDFFGHMGSFIAGALIGLSFSGTKANYGEDSLNIKKLKILCLIIYANYTLVLLSIFLI
jgi:rhomboid protease GluP